MPATTPQSVPPPPCVLSSDITAFTEPLAERVHDLWMAERLAQGWTYGPERDDMTKKHPGLVPYGQLVDAERRFDRQSALGTLQAMIEMGATIEVPPQPLSEGEIAATDAWEGWLNTAVETLSAPQGTPRHDDFDMNDQPELESGRLAPFPILAQALAAFQEEIAPAWKRHDSAAKTIQKRHRRVAWWAIMPGVLAILLAIVQLALHTPGPFTCWFAIAELVVAVIAAVTVARGLRVRTRDVWLAERQASERLRVAKFRALADPGLWCDFPAWRARLKGEVAKVASLDFKAAEHWVQSGCSEPVIPESPPCPVPSADVRAIADYYRAKRLSYQINYFVTKAEEHHHEMWVRRLHLPVLLFFGSVSFVILHVALEGTQLLHQLTGDEVHHAPSTAVTILLALAAALPVFGFGVRAWFSAFELPRRAQLFEGKAAQLKDSLERVRKDRLHPRKTMTHLELGEHFFENEHREWCRLILEAEWFL